MEYIVGIAVIAAIVYLLTRKKEEVVESAPNTVETPEAKVEAVNAQPVAEVKPAKKPAAKKPAAAKKAPAKKPAAKAKKPKA